MVATPPMNSLCLGIDVFVASLFCVVETPPMNSLCLAIDVFVAMSRQIHVSDMV